MNGIICAMELRHAILGLLSIQPMSGYDLGRAFAGSVKHFWHADQSQIYRTIERLTTAEHIATEVIVQDGKPNRKVHTLTDSGRQELSDWLDSPLERQRVKLPFLARLFFIAEHGDDAAQRLLTEAIEQTSAELADFEDIEVDPSQDLAGFLRAATLDYGKTMANAELQWLKQLRNSLVAQEVDHHDPQGPNTTR